MTYFVGVVASVLVLALVIDLLRRGRFKEKYAVWWLLGASIAVILSIFPKLLDITANFLGIQLASNFVFFLAILLLVIMSVQHSAELSKQEAKILILAEHVAVIEHELNQLKTESKKLK